MADGTVVLNQRLLAQTLQNVLVFSNIPEDETGRQTMADAIRSIWNTNIAAGERSNNWQLTNVTFIYNDSLPIYSVDVDFTGGPLLGTSTSFNLPLQTCMLAKTGIVGPPPNRGRVYFGGLVANQLDDLANWGSATMDSAQDFLQDLVNGVSYTGGAGTAFLRIARRDSSGVITSSNPVETVTMDPVPATQRRRRPGVGI